MFLNRKERERDKKIIKAGKMFVQNDEAVTVNVRADSDDQIFSSYNYDNKESLNQDLCDYLWDNVKLMPKNKELNIRLHTKSDISKIEVEDAIKAHYGREYIDVKAKMKRTNIISLVCLILGIMSLGLIVLFHLILDFFLLTTVTEIMAWVFVWEAVYLFFFERTNLRSKCLRLQKIYYAKVEIVKELKIYKAK